MLASSIKNILFIELLGFQEIRHPPPKGLSIVIPFSFFLPLLFFLAAEFPFPSVDAFDLKPLVPAVLSQTIAAITLLSPPPPQSVFVQEKILRVST